MGDFILSEILFLIAIVITLGAQAFVSFSYKKYLKVRNKNNISGSEAARYILDKNGLTNITVLETNGYLTDHYNPIKKEIRLSKNVYEGSSISSLSIACHECGHAIQDKKGYFLLRIRSFIVPFVNFTSYAGYIALVIGIIASLTDLITIGIISEVLILLFQIITLPIEINASNRAMNELRNSELLNKEELRKGRTVLIAAALTYVASLANTLLQILRLLLILNNRKR